MPSGAVDASPRRNLKRKLFKSRTEAAQRFQVGDGAVEDKQTLDRPFVHEREVRLAVAARVVQPDAINVLAANCFLGFRRPRPSDHEYPALRSILDHVPLVIRTTHGSAIIERPAVVLSPARASSPSTAQLRITRRSITR